MKNKLHLVQKTVRLTRTWVATGDVKNPPGVRLGSNGHSVCRFRCTCRF